MILEFSVKSIDDVIKCLRNNDGSQAMTQAIPLVFSRRPFIKSLRLCEVKAFTFLYSVFEPQDFGCKVGCVFPMVVVSIQPHLEFGPNDHRDDTPHFIYEVPGVRYAASIPV